MNYLPVIMMILMLSGAAIIPIVKIKHRESLHGFVMIFMSALVILTVLNYREVVQNGESFLIFGG